MNRSIVKQQDRVRAPGNALLVKMTAKLDYEIQESHARVFPLVDREEDPACRRDSSNHRYLREPQGFRDENPVPCLHPSPSSRIRGPDYTFIDVEYLRARGENVNVFFCGHLSHQEVFLRVILLANYSEDTVAHPQFLSEIAPQHCCRHRNPVILPENFPELRNLKR